MKDLETIMKEYKLVAYNLLNKPDLKRSVFLEGLIYLDNLINFIIFILFFWLSERREITFNRSCKGL